MPIVNHTFEPTFNENSKSLVLGIIPDIKSLEVNFYYSHPQNRFRKIITNIRHVESLVFNLVF